MGPHVLSRLKKIRLDMLAEKKTAEPIIEKLAELFSVPGEDGIAFAKRIDLRMELRVMLTE